MERYIARYQTSNGVVRSFPKANSLIEAEVIATSKEQDDFVLISVFKEKK